MQLFKCFKWPKNFWEIFHIEKWQRTTEAEQVAQRGSRRRKKERIQSEYKLTNQIQAHEWEKPSWREEEECKHMANWPLAVCLGIYTVRLQSTPQRLSPHDRSPFQGHTCSKQPNHQAKSQFAPKHMRAHTHTKPQRFIPFIPLFVYHFKNNAKEMQFNSCTERGQGKVPCEDVIFVGTWLNFWALFG